MDFIIENIIKSPLFSLSWASQSSVINVQCYFTNCVQSLFYYYCFFFVMRGQVFYKLLQHGQNKASYFIFN